RPLLTSHLLICGTTEPVCEMAGTKQRVVAIRDQAALLKRRAEVSSLLVCHDGTRIVMRREVFAHEFVKRNRLRPGDLNGSVQRFRHGDFGHVSSEVV